MVTLVKGKARVVVERNAIQLPLKIFVREHHLLRLVLGLVVSAQQLVRIHVPQHPERLPQTGFFAQVIVKGATFLLLHIIMELLGKLVAA